MKEENNTWLRDGWAALGKTQTRLERKEELLKVMSFVLYLGYLAYFAICFSTLVGYFRK